MIYNITIGQVSGYPQQIVEHDDRTVNHIACPVCQRRAWWRYLDSSYQILDGTNWPDFLCFFPGHVVSQQVIDALVENQVQGFTAVKTRLEVIRKGSYITYKSASGEVCKSFGASKLPEPNQAYFQIFINTVAIPDGKKTLVRAPGDSTEKPLCEIKEVCQRCGSYPDGVSYVNVDTVVLAENGLEGSDFASWAGRNYASDKVIQLVMQEKFTNIRWAEYKQDLDWHDTTAFMNKMRKAFQKTQKANRKGKI